MSDVFGGPKTERVRVFERLYLLSRQSCQCLLSHLSAYHPGREHVDADVSSSEFDRHGSGSGRDGTLAPTIGKLAWLADTPIDGREKQDRSAVFSQYVPTGDGTRQLHSCQIINLHHRVELLGCCSAQRQRFYH